MKKPFVWLMVMGAAIGTSTIGVLAQNPAEAGRDWAYPLGDQAATRFSTLTQISTSNVQNLTRAWTFHTGSGRFAYPPMVVNSVMYFSAPNGVFAIDAVTGQQIWKYPPEAEATSEPPVRGQRGAQPSQAEGGAGRRGGGRGAGAGTAERGPVYWAGTQGSTAGNLVFIGATIDGYFRAFDARNGKELWRDKLPAPSQGMPTTYTGRDGKQYVVIGANGGGFFGAPSSDEVIAYRLK